MRYLEAAPDSHLRSMQAKKAIDRAVAVLRKRPVVRAPLDTAGRFGLPAGEISRFGRWGF